MGLSCPLGLSHDSREDEKGARTVEQGKSERHKLGLIRVENKTESKGGDRTGRGQEVWGHGYSGWVEEPRTIKAQPPAES